MRPGAAQPNQRGLSRWRNRDVGAMMPASPTTGGGMKRDTIITHAGRDPRAYQGVINTPVYRASTVLYAGVDALEHATRHREYGKTYYGLGGTPTTFAFEESVARLEG